MIMITFLLILLDYFVCKQLHNFNAFPLIIQLCRAYEKKDPGIVIQCLGVINSILAVCVKPKSRTGRKANTNNLYLWMMSLID